jgi:ABC-type multidrug transport system fused ATPase/permease subunit
LSHIICLHIGVGVILENFDNETLVLAIFLQKADNCANFNLDFSFKLFDKLLRNAIFESRILLSLVQFQVRNLQKWLQTLISSEFGPMLAEISLKANQSLLSHRVKRFQVHSFVVHRSEVKEGEIDSAFHLYLVRAREILLEVIQLFEEGFSQIEESCTFSPPKGVEHLSLDEMVICSDSTLVRVGTIFLVVLESLVGVIEVMMDEMLTQNRIDVIHLWCENFISYGFHVVPLLLLFFLSTTIATHDASMSTSLNSIDVWIDF